MAHAILLERSYDTLQPLVDEVFVLTPCVHQFYSDGLSTYHQLVYRKGKRRARHDVAPGKEQTYTVEGTNADLRCYVPPLARRSRCFPRHLEKLRALARLFVTCYNHCCVARLKHPQRPAHPSQFLPTLF